MPLDETARKIGDSVKRFIQDERSADFGALALAVFGYQYERNPGYRDFCRLQNASPSTVARWTEIPAVPAAAFKELDLTCAAAALTFRTSGTTRGGHARGAHGVADPSLYEISLREGFRRFVLPDRDRIRILSLVPFRRDAPDSSLGFMADTLVRSFGDDESTTLVRSHRLLIGAFMGALRRAVATDTPVLLFGTTLAFAAALDAIEEARERFPVPRGSRLVDTGGAKGSERALDDGEVVARYVDAFGLPAAACVNEYGMTEMLSQLYNDDLVRLAEGGWRTGEAPVARAIKQVPHWVRTRVLEPSTLADAERGLLSHLDLANCHSVSAILTEDVGARTEHGVRIEGRARGAASRGCSIAMDEWLR
jgi:hypothetical protein